MKTKFCFLALLASVTWASNVHASATNFEPSAELMSFLNSIKASSVARSISIEKFKALPHGEQMNLCSEILNAKFPDLASSLSIGIFKRNDLTNHCQMLDPEKEKKDIGKIQEHQVPKLHEYELNRADVGKLKIPQGPEVASSSSGAQPAKVIRKIVIPAYLLVDEKQSQEEALKKVKEALVEVEKQGSQEDHELQEKIKGIQTSLKTAEEDYDSMGAIVLALREDIAHMNKSYGLFSKFNPNAHEHDTHEVYLESILKQTDDLHAAQRYNQSGELDQLNLAKQKLEESKENLQKAQVELRALAG
ncbi:MAG: hypothetical protein ACTHJ4_07015 [Candidatus Nucleicultricaceae bacterium]